ncbi:MAG: cytochrome c family protein [Betaproteobacteria bacterium]|nr:cytochrome c family protein [Betaproteobacteria bacterium]
MNARHLLICGFAALFPLSASEAVAAGDPARGVRLFNQCAACHSLDPGRHMTGPSLAGIWGRKAGKAQGFARYSEAIKQAGVTWDGPSLDRWLRNPKEFIPGSRMDFPGVRNDNMRADLIAFLKAVSEGKAPAAAGRGGMMGQAETTRLRDAGAQGQVQAIRYCGDTYNVTTMAGKTFSFWEFNLRFKTDSGPDGPAPGRPVLLHGGMMGDRAFVVFSGPEEMGSFIRRECQ